MRSTNRILWVFWCMVAVALLGGDFVLAQRMSRGRRVTPPTPRAEVDTPSPSRTGVVVPKDSSWPEQLAAACEQAKTTAIAPKPADLVAMNREMATVVRQLETAMRRQFKADEVAEWRTRLDFTKLNAALRQQKPLEKELLDVIAGELDGDAPGVRFKLFDPLRDIVRRYRTIAAVLEKGDFENRVDVLFTHLPNYVTQYREGTDPELGFAIAGAIRWIGDMGRFLPGARSVVPLIKRNLDGLNVFVDVSLPLLSLPFKREFSQEFEVKDTIMDASVVGSGTMKGHTTAIFVPREPVAEIKLVLEGELNSETKSRRDPVTLETSTTGTVRAEKSIFVSTTGIKTQPAKAKADLVSETRNLQINAGGVVSNIARRAVSERKGEAQAAAARKAEQRVGRQVDGEANPQIADLDKRFQSILGPLFQTSLVPQDWAFGTTESTFWTRMAVAGSWQVAAPTPPPAMQDADVVVRVHQSAANNGAAMGLAGRLVEEEKLVEELKARFEKVPAALQRPETEPAWRFSFAREQPISLSFDDGLVRLVLRIDQFRRDGVDRVPPADIDIMIAYRVSMQDGKVVWEQAEPVSVFPRGHKSGDQIPARLLASCAPVRERLNAQMPKTVDAKPFELPERFAGKQLIPCCAIVDDGWITLGWKLGE
ncbi:MAG: hypothetical protein ACRC46_15230 [Thermoguttaceae bacterium]